MTMTTTCYRISVMAVLSLLLSTSISALSNNGFYNLPLYEEDIYHINKSTDGQFINDLRGYPNSQPILKLEDAITLAGDGSLGFREDDKLVSVTCNGNINFTVPSTSCEVAITIAPPTSDCPITSTSYVITGGPSAPTGTTPTDPSGTYQVGTYTITWSITDCDGLQQCVQTVSILDMTAPVLTCPMSLNLDCPSSPVPASYADFAEFTAGSGMVSDNCAIDESSFMLLSEVSSGTICDQTIVRTYFIADVNNQTSTCTRTIFIEDNIQPNFTRPINITINCDQNPLDLTLTGDVTDETDNCTLNLDATFVDTNNLTTCGNTTGTILRMWSLSDDCGNVRNRTQTITVQDITLPTVDCSGLTDLILECDGDYTTEINNWLTANEAAALAGASDLCSNISVTNNYIAGVIPALSCDQSAGLQVSFMVSDECGNTVPCSAMLILDDNNAPLVDCTAATDLVLDCDGDYTTEITNWLTNTEAAILDAAATQDACDGDLTISNNYTTGTIPTLSCDASTGVNVIFTVTDDCMNTSTCNADIILTDTTDPTFTVPASITINCEQDPTDLSLTGDVTDETDNCDMTLAATFNDVTVAGTCTDESVITRTWSLTDDCSNTTTQTQTITIQDITAPVAICQNITVDLDAIGQVTITPSQVDNGSSDNCDNALTLALDRTTFFCNDVAASPITVTLTVTDNCDNTSTCTATVTIQDVDMPTIVCPTSLTAICNISESPPYADYDAFIDAGGTYSDMCSANEATFTSVDVSNGAACPTIITRTYSVSDFGGNVATCSQTITVDDNTIPSIVCPANIVVSNDAGVCQAAVTVPMPVVSDNCGIQSTTNNFNNTNDASGVYPTGVTTVIWTITDLCGNINTCSMTVTVNDTTNPVLTCPTGLTAICNISEQPVYADFAAFTTAGGTASDNCMVADATFTLVSEVSDALTCPETITRTYQIADNSGNTGQCTQTIVIDDTVDPSFTVPAAITINCEQDITDLSITGDVTDENDNCTTLQATFVDATVAGACTNESTVTRTWTLADACGNSISQNQIITVEDNTAPVFTCGADFTVNVDAGVCTAMVTIAVPTPTDNCGVVNLMNDYTNMDDASGMYPLGTTTITWTATDACGNTNTCAINLTVIDTQDPIISCPAALTATCLLTEQPAYTTIAAFTAAGGNATDNCSIDATSFTLLSETSNMATCPEVITRVYQVSDTAGNTAMCSQIITINDEEAPTFTCGADITVNTDFGACSAMVTIAVPTPTDNCGVVSLVNDFTNMDDASAMYPTGNTTVTWTATDACGNVETCAIMVTVLDNIVPTITCPSALTATCILTEQPAYANLTEFTAAGGTTSDNCGIDATSFALQSETSNGATCPEVITRVYTISDTFGNASTCSQTVTIDDELPPVLQGCPVDISVTADNNTCNALVTLVVPTATDICGMPTITNNITATSNASGVYDVGTTEVIFTATDDCGNTSTCSAMVTVSDNMPPIFSCPMDLTASCSPDEQPAYTTLAELIAAGGSIFDNCQIDDNSFTLLSQVSDNLSCPETFTRMYQISDVFGNSTVCNQMVVVNDQVDPIITCNDNVSANADAGVCTAALTIPVPVTSDNCGIQSLVNDFNSTGDASGTYPIGMTTVTWTLTDNCNNIVTCSFTVTVADVMNPVITCPAALTATCLLAEQPAYANLAAFTAAGGSATDNCGIDATSFTLLSETSDGAMCPEVITRVYQISDDSGNISTCSQTVTIDDEVDPIITCNANVSVNTDAGLCTAAITIPSPVTSDNCGIMSLVNDFNSTGDASGTYPLGLTTLTWTLTDNCNNVATCSFTVTVTDVMNPVLTCPAALTAVCNISEQPAYTSLAAFTAAGGSATDNCGIDVASFTLLSETSDGLSNPETFTRVYQIADTSGNTITCSQTVTVNDTIQPVLEGCPSSTTVSAEANACSATVALAVPTATDNCVGVTVTNNITAVADASGVFAVGATTVIWTATDASGNTATCSAVVTVTDNMAPVITCPAALTATCLLTEHPAYADLAAFTAAGGTTSDICGIDAASFVMLSETSNGATCPEVITRVYQIADTAGNVSTCSQTVTIDDETGPVFTCGADFTVNVDAGECTAMVTIAVPTPTDNCGVTSLMNDYTNMDDASGMYPLGTTTITWTATDACGNATTCAINLTIIDPQAPVLTCPAALTATCLLTEQPAYTTLAAFTAAGGSATDNCGIDAASFTMISETSNGATCPEVITRVYQVSDTGGNTATCSQNITINDEDAPTFTCGADITVNTDIGVCTAMVTIAVPAPTDNCGVVSLVNDFTNMDDASAMYPIGNTTVTWTATDACGNSTTCAIMITVNDNIAPSITCPPSLTATCLLTEQPAYATLAAFTAAGGSATDNCGIDATSFVLQSEVSNMATCPEVITRVYQISDDSGNVATCSQTVTIDDEVDPIITCSADITVNADPSMCSAAITLAAPITSDNCGIMSLVNDFNNTADASGTYPVGTNTVIWTLTDNCNNVATCSFNVVVLDIQIPTISCPSALMAVCGIAEQPVYADLAAFTAAGGSVGDNCGVVEGSFTLQSETSNMATCPEVITRIYQITDINGNTAACSQTITVDDEVPPVLEGCPVDLTISAATNACNATVTLAVPTATDNCGIPTITNNITTTADASGIYNVGTTEVIFTATDACGNQSTCSAMVTVEDNMPPTFACPTDLTASCGPNEQVPYISLDELVAAGGFIFENCGVDPNSFTYLGQVSDNMTCPETFTRTYQIADFSGNTSVCNQMVVVNDVVVPTIVCSNDITVNADTGMCSAAITLAAPITNDNCGVATTINDFNNTANASGTYPVGPTTVIWTVTDICGNTATCDFTITVNDTEMPTITCPIDMTTSCDAADIAAYANTIEFLAAGGTISDNCGFQESGFTLLTTVSDGNTCPEVVTRTYQITDLSGNTATCSHTITVDDEIAPEFTCGVDITVNATGGMCNAMVSISVPTPTDNCGTPTLINDFTGAADASGIFPVGTTLVTWTATDACMNATTCSINVTVQESESPVLTCPATIAASCGISEQPAYVDFTAFAAAGGTATDNCAIDETTFTLVSAMSDGMSCPETITRTYQVSDVNGNTASCQQLVVVDDTTPPTLVCSGDFTVDADTGVCNAMVTLAIPTNTDNCGIASLTNTFTGVADASGTYPIGTTMIVWTATDLCGNTTTCEVNVTVVDAENPTITCPAGLTAVCDITEQPPYADLDAFIAAGGIVNDNCDMMDLAFSMLTDVSNNLTCPETITRTYVVTDDAGNTATCAQLIVIDDEIVPTITCPLDITANATTGSCEAMVTISEPITGDNCGVATVVNDFTNTNDASAMYPVGTTTVTYTVTDDCDNTTTCSFNVTVNDVDAPVIFCEETNGAPLLFTLDCTPDFVDPINAFIEEYAIKILINTTDLCDSDLEITNDYDDVTAPPVSCDNIPTNPLIVTYTVTDDSGNSATCELAIVFLDETAPTFDAAPAPIADIACNEAFPDQQDLTATDDCGGVTVVESVDAFTVDQCAGYPVTYRWTATDGCGNTTEVTQTFNVLPDTTAPTFDTAPAPIADIDCDEMLPIQEVLTASDECQSEMAVVITSVLPFTVDQCAGYPITYVWTATDNCGNSTEVTQTFNVLPDTAPPVFDMLPTPIDDIECNGMLPEQEVITATDACQDEIPEVDMQVLPFVVDNCNGYEVTYLWATKDICGNGIEITETFMVLADTEGPVFDMQPMDLPDINCNDPLPDGEVLTATDECQDSTFTAVFTVDAFNADICMGYEITYRWTATDTCGNSSEVTETFNILPDTEAPTFDMEAPELDDIDCDEPFPLFPLVTASDNCDMTPSVTTSVEPFIVNQCDGFPVTYVWTATDDCGNTATISSVFNVLADTTPPVFDTQPVPLADINCDDMLPVQETITATDACQTEPIVVVPSVDPFTIDICAGYDITYRWTATDNCGNSTATTVTFAVLPDTEAPVFDTQPTALPDLTCDQTLPIQETLTATDDCSSFNVVATIDPFIVDLCAGYTVTHRWVATDACNNSTVVTESFDVLPDTQAPTFDNQPADLADIPCSATFPDQEDLTAMDDCNIVTIVESVDPFIVDQCNGYNVTYRWTATDACGNSSEVTTSFMVMPDETAPTFDSQPVALADINCDEAFPTQEVLTASDDCGMATVVASVDPFTVNICAGYMVTYRWVATDNCGLTTVVTTSFDVLPDTQMPTITCTDITVGTDDGVCEATIMVPAPPITDNCSAFTVTNDVTNMDNADGTYQLGNTSILWTVTDDCGNINTCTQIITVEDDESPIITCNDNLCATLDSNGAATINAADFISMATDNCGTTNIRVRRMEANGGPCANPDNDVLATSVSFCCADAIKADGTVPGEVMVVVVVDDGNGNETQCMVSVEVKDVIAPTLAAPSMCLPDITISCEFPLDTNNLSVFGDIVFDAANVEDIVINDAFYTDPFVVGQDALFTDNCLDGITVTQTIAGFDDLVCNQGTFTRTLVVTDLSGNPETCVQSITVDDVLPFSESDIQWPVDYEITDCTMVDTNPDITGRPILNLDKCSQPGSSFSDEVFDYPLSGCELIQRTWRVLDWCQYVPNSGSDVGVFEYVQNIMVTNTVAPTFTFACVDTTICSNEMTCLGELNITASATDDCTIESQLFWNHSIDLFNLGTNVINNTGKTLTGTYPRGTHKVTWSVEDRCGNVNTCSYLLTIRDCKAPQVVCINGLSTSLMNMNGGGMIQIWANDFVKNGSDNCTLADDIVYSFSADTTEFGKIFTCVDLGPQTVEVWATDEDGNQSHCVTFIDIQDNTNACGDTAIPMANVSGNLRTARNQGITDAEVGIESDQMAEYMMSEDEGEYAFADVAMYDNYEVRPYKNDDPMNGVSTLDLLIIQKHILALNPLDNPYDLIAADINGSGAISAIDLIELRKLILGVYDDFPNNTSWRFVDAAFEFEHEDDPWPFNEAVILDDLSNDAMETNFIGVKIGDVNGSVTANNLTEGSVENRSSFEGINITTLNQKYDVSDMVTIPLQVSNFKAITGLQMTIAYDDDQLQYVGFGKTGLAVTTQNFNEVDAIPGTLTMSWDDINTLDLKDGASIVNLMFKSRAAGTLLDAITINSSVIQSEVYNKDLQTGAINFEILKSELENFELFQNKPNPFMDATEISFMLPRDMNTTLIIYNGVGKLIHSERGSHKAGMNTIIVEKSKLNVSSGILYYKLKADNFTEVKQMLLIE